jgi:hypothetical protein
MRRPQFYLLLLITFFSFLSISLAACKSGVPTSFDNQLTRSAPTSFCKCTCFGNSTIVALDAPSSIKKPPAPDLRPRASKKTCNDCNRQFCLSYSFCKGEKEENVQTTCFQRDSAKDQAVVFIFIGATVGLLGWAGIRPWVTKMRERRNYIPVSGQGDR